jgi:hypothetical protein
MLPNSMVRRRSGLWVPDQYEDVPLSPAVRVAKGVRGALPGTSATAATGDVFPTQTVSAKEYPGYIKCDEFGHMLGSRDTYYFAIASTVHVAAANTVMWDLFNGHASLLVRVRSILQLPNINTAVTGIAFDWQITRTTAVGTGGTAQTAWLPDTSQTALDALVTCRLKPAGGATASTVLLNYTISSEETNAATQLWHSLAAGGMLDLVPKEIRGDGNEHGILLRPSQGIRCVQVTNSVAGNTGWLVGLTVE